MGFKTPALTRLARKYKDGDGMERNLTLDVSAYVFSLSKVTPM